MSKLVKYRGRSRLFSCYKYVPFNDDTNKNKQGHSYNGKDLSSLKRVRSQERMDSMLGTKNLRTNQKENAFGRNFSNAIKNVFTDASMVSFKEEIDQKMKILLIEYVCIYSCILLLSIMGVA